MQTFHAILLVSLAGAQVAPPQQFSVSDAITAFITAKLAA